MSDDAEFVHCPMCAIEVPRYRLMPDENGIPRKVDMRGVPCPECIREMEALRNEIEASAGFQ